jgi:hypothetical protein
MGTRRIVWMIKRIKQLSQLDEPSRVEHKI